jgi:hypothetical protein
MMNWHRTRTGALAVIVFGLAASAAPEAFAQGWGAPARADRDSDGVPDALDACPDVAGVKTTEAKTNGCPNNPWGAPAGASDRDKDTVPDSIDACPDVAGVKTTDPKTNGCPNNPWGAPAGASDRDKDTVPDSLDA